MITYPLNKSVWSPRWDLEGSTYIIFAMVMVLFDWHWISHSWNVDLIVGPRSLNSFRRQIIADTPPTWSWCQLTARSETYLSLAIEAVHKCHIRPYACVLRVAASLSSFRKKTMKLCVATAILGMKWVFQHQDFQMVGLQLNKYESFSPSWSCESR